MVSDGALSMILVIMSKEEIPIHEGAHSAVWKRKAVALNPLRLFIILS